MSTFRLIKNSITLNCLLASKRGLVITWLWSSGEGCGDEARFAEDRRRSWLEKLVSKLAEEPVVEARHVNAKPRYCIIEPGKGYFQTLAIADFSKVKGDGGFHFR